MALNVTNLIANCLPVLHSDTAGNLVFTSDAELTRLFDEAVKELARRFLVFVRRDTAAVDLVQGTATYSAPSRQVCPLHITLVPDGDFEDAVDLVASSTTELEGLDEAYRTQQGTPAYWYADRSGVNKVGFYPVPDAAAANDTVEVIYAEYSPELDESHVETDIETPAPIGDYLEAQVLKAAYGKESDFALPEVTQNLTELAALYEQAIGQYWGMSQ